MSTLKCISDADLSRLWDGGVTDSERSSFEAHLKSCVACRERWEQMAAGAEYIDTALGIAKVSAGTCPDDELMAQCIGGMLDAADEEPVEEHLRLCADCRERAETTIRLADRGDCLQVH